MDTGLDENEAARHPKSAKSPNPANGICGNVQLGVLVLAVGAEVLAHGNSLLDQHVQVLGDLGGKSYGTPSA